MLLLWLHVFLNCVVKLYVFICCFSCNGCKNKTFISDTMVCTGCCATLDHIVTYLFKQLYQKGKIAVTYECKCINVKNCGKNIVLIFLYVIRLSRKKKRRCSWRRRFIFRGFEATSRNTTTNPKYCFKCDNI